MFFIRRVAGNILNNKLWKADNWWSSRLGVKEITNKVSTLKKYHGTNHIIKSRLGLLWNDISKEDKHEILQMEDEESA